MKPEDTTIEKIHDYLDGIMLPEEKIKFEKELQTNDELRQELIIQQEMVYAIRTMALADQLRELETEMYQHSGEEAASVSSHQVKVVPIRPYARVIRIGLSVAAGIAAMLLLGFWIVPLLQNYFTQEPVTAFIPKKSAFTSPIKGLEVEPQVLELEAEKGKEFQLASGTKISVPPDAFTDASGKKISGRVQLTYREFHDGLEVLASGIPLEDEGRRLEAAGMFEIQGYRNGEPLTLTGDIGIQLASFTDAPGYSHFHLASYTNDSSGIPTVRWQQIAAVSELIVNERKKAYFDSLREVYYAQAEAHAKTTFDNQQYKAQEQAVNGWQIKAVKSNVIMSWLNTQGMEYIGFYPEQEDPDSEEMSWVQEAKWQKANAAVASFMPFAKVNLPSVTGSFTKILFSSDGKNLIINSSNHAILYRASGRLVGKLPVKEGIFTADGEHIIGISDKRELLCYRVSDGAFVTQYGELIQTNSRELNPKLNTDGRHTHYVGQVMDYDVSLDGRRVVTIHNDESAVLWDIDGRMISRRKGLPKSWFTEVMFTNRNGTEMLGKMHDGAIVRLDEQWQVTGRSNTFSRPPNYNAGNADEKWAIIHNINTLRHPDMDVSEIDNNSRMIYKNVSQHVFYINRKQQDNWQAVDTVYVTGHERASLYAIAPDGQHVALLMGNNQLFVWQKTDTDKQIYRLSLEGASFEYADRGITKSLSASATRFYTYVQPGSRLQSQKQQRLATLEELRQRNLKVAEQKLKLAMEKRMDEANYLRIFHVTRFGVYHVTQQFEEVKVAYSQLNLSAEVGGKIKLFQLGGSRQNVVIPLGEFTLNSPASIAFDASGGHLIGVLPDDTVLIFSAADFAGWLRMYPAGGEEIPQLVMSKVAQSEVNYLNLKRLLEKS